MHPSRRAVTAVAALLAAAAPLGISSANAGAQPAPAGAGLARSLGAERAADVALTRSPATGFVRFIATTAGHPLARPAGVAADASPTAVAHAFLTQHGSLFGVDGGGARLSHGHALAGPAGVTVARFTQLVDGRPVVGSGLSVAMTRTGQISYVQAETIPAEQALATPRLTAAQARRIALTVTSRAERVPTRQLTAGPATQAVYAPGVLGVPTTVPTSLVYRVEVDGHLRSHPVRELVLVDAAKGVAALRFNQVARGMVDVVCTAADDPSVADPTCPPTGDPGQPSVVASPGSSADADTKNAYDYAADTYSFYASVVGDATKIGVASGSNRALYSTVHLCDPSSSGCSQFENAFWDGHEMVYGDGFASADDVVAHELTHGVTEHTSNLMYLYQSGAINESMSDVMGELMDQWDGAGTDGDSYRWMLGEDLPSDIGVIRDMKDPTTAPSGVPTPYFFPQPDTMTSPYYYELQDGDSDSGIPEFPDDNGGVHENSGVGNKAAYLIVDGTGADTFNGVAVPGLGGADPATRAAAIAKAAKLYFLVDQTLTSGSDYADLARALPAACAALVGTAGFTSTDCTTVRAAVSATEMTQQPAVGKAPEASTNCGTLPLSTDWYDNLESPGSGRWARTPTGGNGPWYYPASTNIYDVPQVYATSGTHEFWGDDVDPEYLREVYGVSVPHDGTIAMTHTFTVPKGKDAYLRFNHAYQFEWYGATDQYSALYVDGGRVEYTLDNGKHWLSAKDLFGSNGYNHTLNGFDAQGTPTYTFRGFGGDSHGYMSSRLNLAKLAGRSVRFRFRVTDDASVGAYGWYIDDVRFYTCGAKPSAPTAIVASPGVNRETVTWRAPSDHGTSALQSYVVTVRSGSTSLVTRTVSAATHSATFTGLPGGKSLTTWVRAVNASGSGPAAYSNTLAGTAVGLSASATHVPSGHEVTLSGRLLKAGTTSGLAGRRVGLYRAAPGSSHWTWLVSTTTGDRGGYAFHRSPTSDSVFQVRYLGAVPYQGSASAKRTVQVG